MDADLLGPEDAEAERAAIDEANRQYATWQTLHPAAREAINQERREASAQFEAEWSVSKAKADAEATRFTWTDEDSIALVQIESDERERIEQFWNDAIRASITPHLEGLPPMTVLPSPQQPAVPLPDLIKNSAEFLADFTPPNYLIDGVFQQRFCYAITAQGGVGKTAIAMALTVHVALGKSLGGLAVEQGQVLYMAGENPTDIQMRWLGLTQEHHVDPDSLNVHFMPHAVDLFENAGRISQEVVAKGLSPALVVVDTAAAYNFGDEENNNSQQKLYAQQLRSLVNLPGAPCVLILCHPTKAAADDALVPRGGGAFLNEIDGNVAVRKRDSMLTISALAKFRGPEFAPINFALKSVTHPRLVDSKGRSMPTVVANVISEQEGAAIAATARRHEDLVLKTVETHPAASLRERAAHLRWFAKTAPFAPDQTKVKRALDKLEAEKLVQRSRSGEWSLTSKGGLELFPTATVDATALPPMPPRRPVE